MLHNNASWYIDYKGIQLQNYDFTSRFCWDIHDKFPMLKHLGVNIDDYKWIKENERNPLPAFSELQSFQHTGWLYGGVLPNQSVLTQLFTSNLVALNLSFSTQRFYGLTTIKQTFSKEALELITSQFPELKVLKLSGYNPISEVTLIDILSEMTKLEILAIKIASTHRDYERAVKFPDPSNSSIVSLLHKIISYHWKEAAGYGYFHPDDSFCWQSRNKSALGTCRSLGHLEFH